MKTVAQGLVVIALGLFLASSAAAFTGTYTPGEGIIGTVHDMTVPGNYNANLPDSLNRVCIFCHAPHNTYKLTVGNGGPGPGIGGGPEAPSDAFDYLPLWNHELTLNADSYSMYYNGPGAPPGNVAKGSQAVGNMEGPGSISLLCLSCHDGSVAVNSYGNASQLPGSRSGGGATMSGTAYAIGEDGYLGNHHPIGFNYDDVAAIDGEIRPKTTLMGAAGTIESHLSDGTQMECSTCHSVHNKGNDGETLLWRSDQNSDLCLTCHDKNDGTAP